MVEDRIRLEYDALCYSTFINVYTLSKDSTDICLYDLDTSNKEHLFVLSVITACWHMLGEKDIAIRCTKRGALRKLVKKYKKICNIKKIENEEDGINLNSLLEYMRPFAKNNLGENFSFAEIYDEYYAERKDR